MAREEGWLDVDEHMNKCVTANLTCKGMGTCAETLKTRLTGDLVDMFRATCFGKILDVNTFNADASLIHSIMLCEVQPTDDEVLKKRMKFRFGDKEFSFGELEFILITGFRAGQCIDIVQSEKKKKCKEKNVEKKKGKKKKGELQKASELARRLFPDRIQASLKLEDMKALIESAKFYEIPPEDAIKVCGIFLLLKGFMGRDWTTTIPHLVYTLADDLAAWNSFPWGTSLWSYTYYQMRGVFKKIGDHVREHLEKGVERTVKYTVLGFMLPFNIWLYETFPRGIQFAKRKEQVFPRMCAWKRKPRLESEATAAFINMTDDNIPRLMELTPDEVLSDNYIRYTRYAAGVDIPSPPVQETSLNIPSPGRYEYRDEQGSSPSDSPPPKKRRRSLEGEGKLTAIFNVVRNLAEDVKVVRKRTDTIDFTQQQREHPVYHGCQQQNFETPTDEHGSPGQNYDKTQTLTMEVIEPFTKGSTVEVSRNDNGFHGAWYVATVVDIIGDPSQTKETRSSNKKKKNTKDKKKVGYVVKYDTLYQEDNPNEKLTEIVDPLYVRPLPPLSGDGCEFEVSDVVDVYLRDGWWIGVVKKVNVGEGEMMMMMRKYVVSFEYSPEEEDEFKGFQMRLHVDWVNSTWKQRSHKTPNQESINKIATRTSDSNNGAHLDIITPTKKALKTDSAYLTVGCRHSAKTRSQLRKKTTIGALDGSTTYRKRRGVNLDDDDEEELHENFKSSARVENSGSKGNTEDMVSMMETTAAKAQDQDSVLLEQDMIIKETSETRDGNSQLKRKSGRPSKLLSRSPTPTPNASLEDDQEAGKRGSSGIHEITNQLDEKPVSVWYLGPHPLPVSKKNSCYTTVNHDGPIAASNPTMVIDDQTTENKHILPFVKRSPFWALEEYQNLSQSPHFSPLWKTKEECREGLAIGHMVNFANLVQRTTNLQWTDPNRIITNSLETLLELEDNGFDVGPVRVRLDELLSKKEEADRLEGEMKETEKEVEKCNREKMAIDEEINGLERKRREVEEMMREVEEEMVKAVAMKNGKDEEVRVVRSNLQVVSKRIADWKLAFEELAGNPL